MSAMSVFKRCVLFFLAGFLNGLVFASMAIGIYGYSEDIKQDISAFFRKHFKKKCEEATKEQEDPWTKEYLDRLCQIMAIPKAGEGKTIEFRKYDPLPKAQSWPEEYDDRKESNL